MKRMIITICLTATTALALSLSNVVGVVETPVKIAENHVAIEQSAYDKNGKKIILGYKKHYGISEAQAKLTAAQAEYAFYDMNDVEAIAYVAGKKKDALASVAQWQVIVDKFGDPND